MRLTISPWVHHSGGAIYSLDLHPTADKVVTCGQGDTGGDGLVVVWNLLPITVEKCGRDLEANRPLLSKLPHQAGVNCVRWSRCGKFVACAVDDKTVTIWEYSGRIQSAGTVGKTGVEAGNLEKYRCAHTMHSHSMEVMAVDWSWDGHLLASASMDNNVIIWNAKKLPERVIVLDARRGGHSGPVKGLAWDPIGKYLASQAGDKSLRLWTTDSWSVEKTIEEPFEESSQTTMFTRPDWTPDGQFLLAPGAMNNQGPTAQIVVRKGWNSSRDLVGHRKAVTCVRVCPRLFRFTDYNNRQIQASVLAVGSRDKAVSIWAIPSSRRPLVVFTNIFKHTVMDCAWRDFTLLVCSQDGTVKSFNFNEKELGVMLTMEDMADHCEKLYKCRPSHFIPTNANGIMETIDVLSSSAKSNSFIETPAELLAYRAANSSSSANASATMPNAPSDSSEKSTESAREVEKELAEKRKEQIETLEADGKRRIQPIFLCSTAAPAGVSSDAGPSQRLPSLTTGSSSEAPPKDPVKMSIRKKSPSPIPATLSTDDASSCSSGRRRKRRRTTTTEGTTASDESEEDEEERIARKNAKTPPLSTRERVLAAEFTRPALRPISSLPIRILAGTALLDAPELQDTLTEAVPGSSSSEEVSVHNEYATGGVAVSRVSLSRLGKPAWTTLFPESVLFVSANCHWTVVACCDRSLRVLSTRSGAASVCPPLQLDSLAARIGVSGQRTFALSINGFLSAWDLEKRRAIFTRISIVDCVVKETTLNSVSLCPSGAPLLCFSNGNSFAYSADFQSWVLVDSVSPLFRLSQPIPPEELGDGVIGRIAKHRKRTGVAPSVPLSVRAWAGESVVEGWLAAALAIRSPQDLRSCLVAYSKQLVRHHSSTKLRGLLEWLENVTPSSLSLSARLVADLRAEVEKVVLGDPAMASLLRESRQRQRILF